MKTYKIQYFHPFFNEWRDCFIETIIAHLSRNKMNKLMYQHVSQGIVVDTQFRLLQIDDKQGEVTVVETLTKDRTQYVIESQGV